MLQIQKTVVNGCSGQHKHLLARSVAHHIKQLTITIGCSVSKVVSFINNNDFCLFRNLIHQILIFFQKQIRMVDDFKWIKAFKYLRNVFFYGGFPHGNTCRRGNDKHNIFALFFYETFN